MAMARQQKRVQQQDMYLHRQDEADASQGWFAASQKPAKTARLDIVTHHQQGELLIGLCTSHRGNACSDQLTPRPDRLP
jgi:hypothetical protein